MPSRVRHWALALARKVRLRKGETTVAVIALAVALYVVVYPFLGLPPDERDFYPDEENAGDLVQIQRVIEGGFEALERYQHLVDGPDAPGR